MNKWILLVLTFLIHINVNAQFNSQRVVLITCLYNEDNPERAEEYLVCLKQNLACPFIDVIHVIYDTTNDDKIDTSKNAILNYLIEKSVLITYTNCRQSYEMCFDIANTLYPNSKVIVSNADIYFNHTLEYLKHYNLTGKFLTLTRWNVKKDGSLDLYRTKELYGTPDGSSHDSWVFTTPLRPFKNSRIELGTKHCDGRIAFQAQQAGLHVLNPCLTLQTCHVHLTGLRRYPNTPYPRGEMLNVPFSTLE